VSGRFPSSGKAADPADLRPQKQDPVDVHLAEDELSRSDAPSLRSTSGSTAEYERGRRPQYTTLEAAVAAGEAEVGLVCTTYRVWEFDDEGWLSGPVATGP